MSEVTDDRLRSFLFDRLRGFEELEALLFLARNENRDFSTDDLTRELKAHAESMHDALQALEAASLLEVTERSGVPRYRFAPGDEATRAFVECLASAHAERRFDVIQMLSANALERVRGAAMRRLADAFRIERHKK